MAVENFAALTGCGQRVEVLSLSSKDSVEEEAEHQKREEEYRRVFVG